MNVSSWLKTTSIDRLDAELIVAKVLRRERTFLHAHPDYELSQPELTEIKTLTDRRTSGEPLAYILGYKEFCGRRFMVTKDVLIPRPETETFIVEAAALKPRTIIDVGTGSGCIAVSLAKELPDAKITAVDISERALAVARQNAEKHHVSIDFRQSDLLDSIPSSEKYDLIVANLPYVDEKWDWNGPELSFEPRCALYAADGGLELIKHLIDQTPLHLTPKGHLILEADTTQHQKVIEYAIKTDKFTPIKKADENSALLLVLCLKG